MNRLEELKMQRAQIDAEINRLEKRWIQTERVRCETFDAGVSFEVVVKPDTDSGMRLKSFAAIRGRDRKTTIAGIECLIANLKEVNDWLKEER